MGARRRNRGLVLAVLVAGGVLLALGPLQQEEAEEETAPEEEATADSEIDSMQLRQRDGDDQWQLEADHAAHFADGDFTRLRTVRLAVERERRPPLRVRSRRGRIEDGSRKVTLKEDVEVVDPEGYRLTTEILHYTPAESRAETDEPVRIVADFGEATGIGATLWTAESRIKLHRQALTTFWRSPGDSS